jgi:hypothetical protein
VLDLSARLRPNSAEVAAKVMDGEAIMINLSNGMYYSMDQVGGVVWDLVAAERSAEEIVAALVERYEVDVQQARQDVERLLGELLEHDLIRVGQPATSTTTSRSTVIVPAPTSRQPYAPPVLNVYSDMGDLLALDPPMPGLDDIPWGGSPGQPAGQGG